MRLLTISPSFFNMCMKNNQYDVFLDWICSLKCCNKLRQYIYLHCLLYSPFFLVCPLINFYFWFSTPDLSKLWLVLSLIGLNYQVYEYCIAIVRHHKSTIFRDSFSPRRICKYLSLKGMCVTYLLLVSAFVIYHTGFRKVLS